MTLDDSLNSSKGIVLRSVFTVSQLVQFLELLYTYSNPTFIKRLNHPISLFLLSCSTALTLIYGLHICFVTNRFCLVVLNSGDSSFTKKWNFFLSSFFFLIFLLGSYIYIFFLLKTHCWKGWNSTFCFDHIFLFPWETCFGLYGSILFREEYFNLFWF